VQNPSLSAQQPTISLDIAENSTKVSFVSKVEATTEKGAELDINANNTN
jgi:hypothetical protein